MFKLVTERAHLMCPNMFFGIQFKIEKNYDEKNFSDALSKLSHMHPTTCMNVVFDELNDAYLKDKNACLTYSFEEALDYKKIFHNISKASWDVTKEHLLRIFISANQGSFDILFVAHHILCDGRGLLTLVQDFADIYVTGKAPKAIIPQFITSNNDLPKKSTLPFISKVITNDANKRFSKENHKVSYSTYLEFEKDFGSKNLATYENSFLSIDETAELLLLCKKNNVSVNDYLVAKMMQQEKKNTLLIASDIRSKINNYVPNSIGNFATAYSIKVKNPNIDLLELAKNVKNANKKIQATPSREMLVLSFYLMLDKNLLDAVAISSLGNYPSESGAFVGNKMFGYEARSNISITNLGKYESNTISEAFFIPPASPANKKTWGILTLNNTMKIVKAEA